MTFLTPVEDSSVSVITYASTANPPGKGTLPPPIVTSAKSPNHGQRFLSEFGGLPNAEAIEDLTMAAGEGQSE